MDKVKTTPPIASLELLMATLIAKRRQPDDRVGWRLAPKSKVIQCVDGICRPEDNMNSDVIGEPELSTAGSMVSHVVQ